MKKNKVYKFNELMDPELGIELGLHNFLADKGDQDYFFDSKPINKMWDEGVIKVWIYNVQFEGDSLIFQSKISIDDKKFDIYLLVDHEGLVQFGSPKGMKYVASFEKALMPEFEYFQDMFWDIYYEIIPNDFWQVKSKVN